MDYNAQSYSSTDAHSPRGSTAVVSRIGRVNPLRGYGIADWLQVISIIAAAAVIWTALLYSR
jgi:hypothetical protein